MWMSYISRPDAIILAVAPAAQDIFADEAIKTALAVDPEGDRTVGACRGRRSAIWARRRPPARAAPSAVALRLLAASPPAACARPPAYSPACPPQAC